MKAIKIIFPLFCVILVIAYVLLATWFINYAEQRSCKRGYDACLNRPVIEQMMHIQRITGCKKIDGKVGPEMKRIVNPIIESELPAWKTKQAEKYMGGIETITGNEVQK